MSSREPLWFCHECHAEMRPLMVPDPVCASCRGSFVEKMENASDDPREFAHPVAGDLNTDGLPPGIDTFLMTLQGLMEHGIAAGRSPPRFGAESPTGNRVTFQVRRGSGPGQRLGTINVGDANTGAAGRVPTMSEFVRRGSDAPEGPTITGPIMAQYLMALLGHRGPNTMFGPGLGGLEDGRMGDYVFNQEALDHIITQLMENSNAHRPVPATEEIITNLPREVLESHSPTLEKDCAVCKEQFKLETEDPDEQVIITLPCKHPFHEPCILPWLKSSGTCPVCRHALVPQPDHHPSPSPGGSRGSQDRPASPPGASRPRSPERSSHDPSGLFHSLFGGLVGGRGANTTGSTSGHRRSSSDQTQSRGNDSRSNVPGSWNDDLD